ncbi:glycosyltransferase family 4 protein [Xanthovirga aplysinae]|uniref:glycosyltransferase family 4 protein n=1 Tax=Xanthovirga aplysinae TaxID=2529853 RepID=UPI0012BD581E|nr:glycosyltransferase family 4 protein [Xanthovirga aplysinae]MTI30975.1 glycosyltransferase [Xanthovirga aplysinae]
MKKDKYVCVHLLNDFSGSPNVLKQAIKVMQQNGFEVDVFTSRDTVGFLSDLNGVSYQFISYKNEKNKFLTLFNYLKFQVFLFFHILIKYRNVKNVSFLINTVHPFGAALAGRLLRKKVVYYIHETLIKPDLLKKFLFFIVRLTSSVNIFVSKYLKQEEGFKGSNNHVIYNTLDKDFWEKALKSTGHGRGEIFNIVFLGSNKAYKGVDTFFSLAKRLTNHRDIHFLVMLNAPREEIDLLRKQFVEQRNLTIFDSSNDVHDLYKSASIVLNLSKPDLWIETFGLTLLEAFSYGVPVISPNIGGPLEVVDHGMNGYCIDVTNIEEVIEHILNLKNEKDKYLTFSNNAFEKSKLFQYRMYEKRIKKILF